VGNVTHLAMALFASMAGLDMVHVPYKGGAPSLIGLMGGEVQLLFSSIPGALPHIKAGRIRAIGVSIRERSQALPDVPTIAEAGVPGYYAASWYGLFLPAGTPSVRVNTLSKQIMASMKSPDVKTKMLKLGFEPVGSDPAEFARFLDEEIARWAKVVKMAGITPK
jgi:tripartite-type tricarboxylate transporter receptor subunit TctC